VDRGGAHGLGGVAGGRWEVAIDGEPSADKEAAGDGAPPSNAVDGSSLRMAAQLEDNEPVLVGDLDGDGWLRWRWAVLSECPRAMGDRCAW
jgi:hypothetical protein